jgi:hypothetical protein
MSNGGMVQIKNVAKLPGRKFRPSVNSSPSVAVKKNSPKESREWKTCASTCTHIVIWNSSHYSGIYFSLYELHLAN